MSEGTVKTPGAYDGWPWNDEVILTDLVQTCEACPAQWEGRTILDQAVYIRYRHGILLVEVDNATVWRWRLGEAYDGYLDEIDLFKQCEGQLSAEWLGRTLTESEANWRRVWEEARAKRVAQAQTEESAA